jgi:hypothetical protein
MLEAQRGEGVSPRSLSCQEMQWELAAQGLLDWLHQGDPTLHNPEGEGTLTVNCYPLI